MNVPTTSLYSPSPPPLPLSTNLLHLTETSRRVIIESDMSKEGGGGGGGRGGNGEAVHTNNNNSWPSAAPARSASISNSDINEQEHNGHGRGDSSDRSISLTTAGRSEGLSYNTNRHQFLSSSSSRSVGGGGGAAAIDTIEKHVPDNINMDSSSDFNVNVWDFEDHHRRLVKEPSGSSSSSSSATTANMGTVSPKTGSSFIQSVTRTEEPRVRHNNPVYKVLVNHSSYHHHPSESATSDQSMGLFNNQATASDLLHSFVAQTPSHSPPSLSPSYTTSTSSSFLTLSTPTLPQSDASSSFARNMTLSLYRAMTMDTGALPTLTSHASTTTTPGYPLIMNGSSSSVGTGNFTAPSPSIANWLATGKVQIPLYAIIFFLAVIGNSLVILTLVQNKRMRTITNVFLLNLAISDLFVGVLCMPFTLVGMLKRDFVFGEFMCKILPFLQGKRTNVISRGCVLWSR